MELLLPYPIRLVVIDYALKHWEDPKVQELFCKITGLKLKGYWKKHGHDSVVPVDVSDLIGANIATCYETPSGLVPIMAFRMLTLSRCDAHRVEFPALGVLRSSGQPTRELEAILSQVRAEKRDIVYASSWTRAESVPTSTEGKHLIRDLHTANIINFMETRAIHEFTACSVLKFKVNEHFDYLGMKRISAEFAQYSVFDQIVAMYHLSDFSKFTPASLEDRSKMSRYWNSRIELGARDTRYAESEIKRAA